MAGLCDLKILLLWAGVIGLANYFLNASEIQTVSTERPAKREPELHPNCDNLFTAFTCWGTGRSNEPRKLSELEPFTDYSCIVQIKDNNVIIKNTTAVHVRIDCDFTIIYTKKSATNTSIELSWTTTNQNCQDHHLQKLSYNCTCGPTPYDQKQRNTTTNENFVAVTVNKQPTGGTCHITGLQPFTSYICEVQPIYNNKRAAKPTTVTQTTETGIPEDITKLTVKAECNVIFINCVHSNRFNGPEKKYIARLHYGTDTLLESKKTKCEFEIKDLSYSTIYTVQVTAFNGKSESKAKTEHVSPLNFLDANKIHQTVSTKLPAKIEPKLPPNCNYLSTYYTCWEHGRVSEPKKLSELEPFTDYSCIGQIKDNNLIIKNTTAVHVRIDCDFTIIYTKNSTTNTSTELSWNTISQKCQDHHLQKLSYDCTCGPTRSDQKQRITVNKQPTGGTCHISGLQPFTSYTFEVQPTYNNKRVAKPTTVTQTTETGIPEDITKLMAKVPNRNVIFINCVHSNLFNGPEKKYIARLHYGSDTLLKSKKTKCEFEFRDLSYSTTYTVQVTAFNGKFESKPKTEHVATLYNAKAVIGFLVFLINLTSVTIFLEIYKKYVHKNVQKHVHKHRKSRDVNEDAMFQSTASYFTVQRPCGCHHKRGR